MDVAEVEHGRDVGGNESRLAVQQHSADLLARVVENVERGHDRARSTFHTAVSPVGSGWAIRLRRSSATSWRN